MTRIAAVEGADLWAPTYDPASNPLLALEMRCVAPRFPLVESLLDVACGTGRWMVWARQQGIRAMGIDASHAMLMRAPAGRCAQATLTRAPVKSDAADLAICSFALSYVSNPEEALRELARMAHRVLVSDLHPAAEAAGWKRTFRAADEIYELDHNCHSIERLDRAAAHAGLKRSWRMEVHFGEPERHFFVNAGGAADFHRAREIPAVLATLWER